MAEKASWPLTEKYLHGTYHDGEMVFRQRPGGLLSHHGDLKYYSLYVELSIKIYIIKSRKIDPIFEFTVASSELSITNLHQQTGDMAGLCGTSLIQSWGKVRKWTVPDLRKTNQTIPPAHQSLIHLSSVGSTSSGEMSGTEKFPFRLLKIPLSVTNYCLFGY